jgi:hypothetical protein
MEIACAKQLRAIRDKEVVFGESLTYADTVMRGAWRRPLDAADLEVLFAHHDDLAAASARLALACADPAERAAAGAGADAAGDPFSALAAAAAAVHEACALAADAAPLRRRRYATLIARRAPFRKLVEAQAKESNRVTFEDYADLPLARAEELLEQLSSLVSAMARIARKGKVEDVDLGRAQYAAAR